MRFLKFIQEKLNLSQFRSYVKSWKESGVSSRYDDVFGNKDRIYVPYKYTPPKNQYSGTKVYIESALKHYVEGNYEITDYEGGYAKNDTGRTMKIGKLLSNTIQKFSKLPAGEYYSGGVRNRNVVTHLEGLLKDFQGDEIRQATKTQNYLIAISRHAYDVAGMSTHLKGYRGWTSCQNLNTGALKSYVERDIKAGTIIAYLIREDDKNIEKPLGRVLLKPFENPDTGDWILLPAKKYGTTPPNFRKAVEKWANQNFNKGKTGTFWIDPEVYKGSDIKGTKTIKTKMSMKEFKLKQTEMKVPIIETGRQFVDWFADKENWDFIKDKLKSDRFDDMIGKQIIGIPYIKKTLRLTPDEIKEAYMSHYFEEKNNLRSYHSGWWVHDILPYLSNQSEREIDMVWAAISLFTAYDGIEKITDFSFEKVENLIEEKYKLFFYNGEKTYIKNDSDKKLIIDGFKEIWEKYKK